VINVKNYSLYTLLTATDRKTHIIKKEKHTNIDIQAMLMW